MAQGTERDLVVAQLRDEIRRIERRPARRDGVVPCGRAEIDALLPGGGFRCGALTELVGGPASGKAAAALALFAALGAEALLAWVDGPGQLYPPAAAALGVDLARLLVVRPAAAAAGAHREQEPAFAVLWAAEALLASGAFAAVVIDARPAARLAGSGRGRAAAAGGRGEGRGHGGVARARIGGAARSRLRLGSSWRRGERPPHAARRAPRRRPMRRDRGHRACSRSACRTCRCSGSAAHGRTNGDRRSRSSTEGRVVHCDPRLGAQACGRGRRWPRRWPRAGASSWCRSIRPRICAALRALAEAVLALAPAVEVVAAGHAPPRRERCATSPAAAPGGDPRIGRRAGRAERALAARTVSIAEEMGYAARAAVGGGRAPARALARHGTARSRSSLRRRSPRRSAGLPARGARARAGGGRAAPRARRGRRGGARAAPAGTLAHRFGPAGVQAARLARGEDDAPLVARTCPRRSPWRRSSSRRPPRAPSRSSSR